MTIINILANIADITSEHHIITTHCPIIVQKKLTDSLETGEIGNQPMPANFGQFRQRDGDIWIVTATCTLLPPWKANCDHILIILIFFNGSSQNYFVKVIIIKYFYF